MALRAGVTLQAVAELPVLTFSPMTPIHHSQFVTAWIPIRSTVFDRNELNVDIVTDCIGAFVNSLPAVLPLLVPEVSEVNVTNESPSPALLGWLSRNSSLIDSKLFDFYVISAKVSFVDNRNKLNQGDDASFLSAIAGYYLEKAISLSLHLSELAYPGSIMTGEGVVADEGRMLANIDGKYFLSCARQYDADSNSWPEIKILDLTEVALWATSIGFAKSSFATTRLQRTLAAFTHVIGLGRGNDGEILFRSMQGLEAFYCDGVGDLRRQLAHKSQVWLGPSDDKLNVVGKLYDVRSKFIHGSAKMQYWHDLSDPWEEDRKTMEQFSDGVEFATRLLLTTLQKCVLGPVTDVNWTYTCNVSQSVIEGQKSR